MPQARHAQHPGEPDGIRRRQLSRLRGPAPVTDKSEQLPERHDDPGKARLARQLLRVRPFVLAVHQVDQRRGEGPLDLLERFREPGIVTHTENAVCACAWSCVRDDSVCQPRASSRWSCGLADQRFHLLQRRVTAIRTASGND